MIETYGIDFKLTTQAKKDLNFIPKQLIDINNHIIKLNKLSKQNALDSMMQKITSSTKKSNLEIQKYNKQLERMETLSKMHYSKTSMGMSTSGSRAVNSAKTKGPKSYEDIEAAYLLRKANAKTLEEVKAKHGDVRHVDRVKSGVGLGNLASQFLPAVGIAAAGKQAMDYNDSLVELTKKMTLTTEETAKYEKFVGELRGTVNMSREEINALSKTVAGAGFDTLNDEFMSLVKNSAMLGSAFDMAGNDAFDMLLQTKTAFNLPVSSMGELADSIAYMDKVSATSAKLIMDTLQRTAGSAKQFGLSFNQNLGLSTALLELTGNSELAGTAVRELLTNLAIAPMKGKKFQEAMKTVGITDTKQFNIDRIKDPVSAIQKFFTGLKNVKAEDRASVLYNVFGQSLSASNVAALSENLDLFIKKIAEASDTTKHSGVVAEQAAKEMNKTSAKLAVLGDKILPLVSFAITELTTYLDGIITAIEFVQKGFSKLSEILGLSDGALNGFISTLVSVGAQIGIAVLAYNALGWAISASLGPWGIALRVMIALIPVAIGLWKKFGDNIINFFQKIVAWVGNKLSWLTGVKFDETSMSNYKGTLNEPPSQKAIAEIQRINNIEPLSRSQLQKRLEMQKMQNVSNIQNIQIPKAQNGAVKVEVNFSNTPQGTEITQSTQGNVLASAKQRSQQSNYNMKNL